MGATNSQELPVLSDLGLRACRFLETDSKMSRILLATDGASRRRKMILKIARVDQRSRAEANRSAIRNAAEWLEQFQHYPGVINIQPIRRQRGWLLRPWKSHAEYCSTLAGSAGNPDFLIVEYLAGESLRDFVGDSRLGIARSLQITQQVAGTLAYLHSKECVHRDIKPENILFRRPAVADPHSANPMAVLLDFGIATLRGEEKLVSGSRLWMAPELQEAYEADPMAVDPSWDVYALGLILCYMITGRRPRRRKYEYHNYENYRNRAFRVIDREVDDLGRAGPAVRKKLKNLIGHTLARSPESRPTAAEMAEEVSDLLRLLGGRQAAGLRPQGESKPLPVSRLLDLRLAGILAAAVIVLLLLLLTTPAATRLLPVYGEAGARGGADSRQSKEETAALPSVPSVPVAATPVPAEPTDPIAEPAPTLVPFTQAAPIPTLIPAATAFAPAQVGRVALVAPAADAVSDEEAPAFVWEVRDYSLTPDRCFEPVFWLSENELERYSPLGAIRENRVHIPFDELASTTDPGFRSLLASEAGFNWGVRIVLCASPLTILRDVDESRTYTYAK